MYQVFDHVSTSLSYIHTMGNQTNEPAGKLAAITISLLRLLKVEAIFVAFRWAKRPRLSVRPPRSEKYQGEIYNL